MLAERASMRVIGKVVVLAFPIAVGLLLLLPSMFVSLVIFAALYGAANGILTIVRGLAVPEMLTRDSYGAINSVLAIPGTIAKAVAPLFVALLWSASGSYASVMLMILASSTLVVGGFWFATTQPQRSPQPRIFQAAPEESQSVG
jgi:hypothetical protein